MNDFLSPDWDAPLDVSDYVRTTPKTAQIKGMFLAAIVDGCREKGEPLAGARDRYLSFNDYPLVEHLELMAKGAPVLFPGRSLRRALRSTGRASYATFVRSVVGRVVFGGSAVEMMSSIVAMIRGYNVAMPCGKLDIVDSSATSVTLRMSGMYTFLDSHHVGVFEGVARACGVRAEVRVRLSSLVAGDMLITW